MLRGLLEALYVWDAWVSSRASVDVMSELNCMPTSLCEQKKRNSKLSDHLSVNFVLILVLSLIQTSHTNGRHLTLRPRD